MVQERRPHVETRPSQIDGPGLVLRRWDRELVSQLAAWGEHGFPYHPFDLGHLSDPVKAGEALARALEEGPHLHFVACEGRTAVGRVSVNLRDPAGLYLWSVHVPPEHEGRGVCRRMLAALMQWLEVAHPGKGFVLTTNTFALRAHRAYEALGFRTSETRWHFDRQLAEGLWKAAPEERAALGDHVRFHNGQWEVRTFLMRRPAGARMETGARGTG